MNKSTSALQTDSNMVINNKTFHKRTDRKIEKEDRQKIGACGQTGDRWGDGVCGQTG